LMKRKYACSRGKVVTVSFVGCVLKRLLAAAQAAADGGKGGDVVLLGVRDIAALSEYRYQKKFHAEDGEAGKNELKQGAMGADMILKVPVGTVARVLPNGEEYEITKEGEQIVLFKGGRAGLGNARFRSSTNQNPFERTVGNQERVGISN